MTLVPFDESMTERFWPAEEGDKLLPSPGFITDFVLATRGVSSPTALCIWSSLWVLSTVLVRDAWIEWYPDPFYANIYVFVVGPPKFIGKTTAVMFASGIRDRMLEFIPDPVTREQKNVRIIRGRATPESIPANLAPQTVNVLVGQSGRLEAVFKGTQGAIVASELATLLDRKKYNVGIVELLTDLYDCHDVGMESLTKTGGSHPTKDVYLTLFAGATKKSLEDSLPESAFGEGFMSRVILLYQPLPTRKYHRPRPVPGGPTKNDLAERLAWVASTARGQYEMDSEAESLYHRIHDRWYDQATDRLKSGETRISYRYDISLLKLALLMRVQRYEPGQIITLNDVKDAARLLDYTISNSFRAVEDVGSAEYFRSKRRIEDRLQANGAVTRTDLLRSVSPYGVRAREVTEIVNHLSQEGMVAIRQGDRAKSKATSTGAEIYRWVG